MNGNIAIPIVLDDRALLDDIHDLHVQQATTLKLLRQVASDVAVIAERVPEPTPRFVLSFSIRKKGDSHG